MKVYVKMYVFDHYGVDAVDKVEVYLSLDRAFEYQKYCKNEVTLMTGRKEVYYYLMDDENVGFTNKVKYYVMEKEMY